MRMIRSQFVLGMIVGASALGAGILLGGAGDDEQTPGAAPETVRARQFEVVDELGTVQLVIGSNDQGGSVSVRDRFGRTILLAGAAEHGGMLVVSDVRSSGPALMAGATASGGAVQLFDAAGTRMLDALADEGGGRLILARRAAEEGTADRTAMRLEVGERGEGILTSYAAAGGRLFRLYADAGDGGVIETYGSRTGRPRVTLSSTIAGQGQIKTAAESGEPLVVLTASEANEGQLYTYNANGNPLVAIATRASGPTLRVFNADGAPVITIEADEQGHGTVGVWRPDGSGQSVKP